VLHGENEAAFERGVGGDDEINGGVGSDRASPLDVEIGFDGGVVGPSGLLMPSTPGSLPSMMTWGGLAGRLKSVRN